MGERVPCSFREAVRAGPDGCKVGPAVGATAGPDPQLAADGQELSASRHGPAAERQPVEEGEPFSVPPIGEEDLDAEQPRLEGHLAACKGVIVEIEGRQGGAVVVISAPAPKNGPKRFAFPRNRAVARRDNLAGRGREFAGAGGLRTSGVGFLGSSRLRASGERPWRDSHVPAAGGRHPRRPVLSPWSLRGFRPIGLTELVELGCQRLFFRRRDREGSAWGRHHRVGRRGSRKPGGAEEGAQHGNARQGPGCPGSRRPRREKKGRRGEDGDQGSAWNGDGRGIQPRGDPANLLGSQSARAAHGVEQSEASSVSSLVLDAWTSLLGGLSGSLTVLVRWVPIEQGSPPLCPRPLRTGGGRGENAHGPDAGASAHSPL